MASVREVYNALQDLANKDERGFISPENFNAFAPVAQTKVFNSIFDRLTGLERLRIRNVDSAGDKSLIKQAKEDLARFSKESTRTRTTGNHFSYPDDFAKVIAIRTYGDVLLGTSTTKPVSIIYDEEKFAHVLNSTLSAPTTDRPVAFVSNEIVLYPKNVLRINLRYYKQPEGLTTAGVRTASLPKLGFTTVAGKEVYSDSGTIDFELPDHYVPDLVREMAMMVGINLRDQAVMNYSNQQPQQ